MTEGSNYDFLFKVRWAGDATVSSEGSGFNICTSRSGSQKKGCAHRRLWRREIVSEEQRQGLPSRLGIPI